MKKFYLACFIITLSLASSSFAQPFSPFRLIGSVYVMDNNPDGNRIIFYGRFTDGRLFRFGSVRTGGLGAGDNASADPLGGQESIVLSDDNRFLYLVNAGSDSISVFFINRIGRPILIQEVSSNGDFPVSLTIDDDLLYVLNSGSDGSIAGYDIANNGRLSLIEGSIRSLGTGQVGPPVGGERNIAPGDIAFDSINRRLVIPFGAGTELGEGRVLSFTVDDNDLPSENFVETVAQGRLPFSVDFTRNGTALISDALGPFAGDPASGDIGGGLSSFDFTDGANLVPINTVANGQIETCWVRVAHTSDLVFTTSTGAGAISTYSVSRNGQISVVDPIAATGIVSPIDFDLTDDDEYLYVTTGAGGVRGFAVDPQTGELNDIGLFPGLPIFDVDGFAPQGLAIR